MPGSASGQGRSGLPFQDVLKQEPAAGEWSRASAFSIKLKKYIIKEQECGCLMKDGRFVEMLTAGKYSYLDMLGYEVQTVPMTGEVRTCQIPEEILMKDEKFASRVVKAVLPDECIALRFVNKAYREVITKPETLYWNVFEKNEFQLIDITQPHMEDTL